MRTWSDRYPAERVDDPEIDCAAEWHDDYPDDRAHRFVTTQVGDLDCAGRPLKPGS